MGYLTNYSLDIIQGNGNINHVAAIGNISGYGEDWENEPIRWYSCEEEVMAYSKLYPDTVFELTGYGQEQDDIWRYYYRNGKVQKTKAKIVFEDFDEDDLR